MGAAAAKAAEAKAVASHKPKEALQVKRTQKGYYAEEDIDGYKTMRTADGIKSKMMDKDLLAAVSDCLKDDGKVSVQETKDIVMPKITDGRGNKSEFTCNERWTIRYALGEFHFDEGARELINLSTKTMSILDVHDKEITDPVAKDKALMGPTLAELGQPQAKRAKGASENLIWVDGMMLDRGMLRALKEGVADDGVVDALEAVKIFNEGADDGEFTRAERWTLRFILSAYTFTDAAFYFLVEALSKLQQTDDKDA